MIRIIMHGCNGKMGQTVTGLLKEDTQAKIVAGIDPYDGIKNDYPVFARLSDCTAEADVIIDFANAAAVEDLLAYSVENQVPVVLCTTGMNEAQLAKIEEAAKQVAVLKSANMSLGINTLINLLRQTAPVFTDAGFDVEIVEKHHRFKLDAPSGTALALADAVNEGLEADYAYKFDRSKERKQREKAEIGISSVRGGTIAGEHEVIFAGTDEVITFKHTAYSRAVFAKGAILAAKFLAGKGPGRYDMQDVICQGQKV